MGRMGLLKNEQGQTRAEGGGMMKRGDCSKLGNLERTYFLNVSMCDQSSEYARICLDRVLNIFWVLNMPGF